jgi:hypothetical protein
MQQTLSLFLLKEIHECSRKTRCALRSLGNSTQYAKKSTSPGKKSLFGYIKGISPDQYGVHAHCISALSHRPRICQRNTLLSKKSLVVKEFSWVMRLIVDKILSLTSLKVSSYFSDNLSEHFSEYLMHILTNKSGKICINFEKKKLGAIKTRPQTVQQFCLRKVKPILCESLSRFEQKFTVHDIC